MRLPLALVSLVLACGMVSLSAQFRLKQTFSAAPSCKIFGPTTDTGFTVGNSEVISITGQTYDPDGVTVTWTCDNCTVTSGTDCTSTCTDISFDVTTTSGAHVVVATCDDGTNTSTDQITLSTPVISDPEAPMLTVTTPSVSPFVTVSEPVSVAGTCDDNVAVDDVSASILSGPCASPSVTGLDNWSFSLDFTAVGICQVDIVCSDAVPQTDSQTITVDYRGTLTISTTTMQAGEVNLAYSRQLAATGGITPYTWSESGSALGTGACAGLSISSAGLVSGTPTTEGTCNFTAQADDSDAPANSDTQALSITVNAEGSDTSHDHWNALCADPGMVYCNSLRSDAMIQTGSTSGGSALTVAYDTVQDAANYLNPSGSTTYNVQGRIYDSFTALTSGSALIFWEARADDGYNWRAAAGGFTDDPLRTHKAFQIRSPQIGGSGRWNTVKWAYKQADSYCGGDPNIVRTFFTAPGNDAFLHGPGTIESASSEQLLPLTGNGPNAGEACIKADEWVRYWLHYDGLDANYQNAVLSSGNTAQGGTTTTIQLASSETFSTGQLVGDIVEITSGTQSGRARQITAYDGPTDTATIQGTWPGSGPDGTSVYSIYDPTWVTYNVWFSTESIAPFQVYDDLLLGLDGLGITGWQIQFNTSEKPSNGNEDPRDRNAWIRNVAIVTDITKAEVAALLEQP